MDEIGKSNVVFIVEMLPHLGEVFIEKLFEQLQFFRSMIFLQLTNVRTDLWIFVGAVIVMTLLRNRLPEADRQRLYG